MIRKLLSVFSGYAPDKQPADCCSISLIGESMIGVTVVEYQAGKKRENLDKFIATVALDPDEAELLCGALATAIKMAREVEERELAEPQDKEPSQ